MTLNHINIPVANVAVTKDFFEQYLDFACIEIKDKNDLAVLKGRDGFILVLMSQAFNKNDAQDFPSAFHIGFLLPARNDVDTQYKRLNGSGIPLQNEPGNMRGVYGFYFKAPGKYSCGSE